MSWILEFAIGIGLGLALVIAIPVIPGEWPLQYMCRAFRVLVGR